MIKLIEVRIVKEVKMSDGLWRFACGDIWKLLIQYFWTGSMAKSFLTPRTLPWCGPRALQLGNLSQNINLHSTSGSWSGKAKCKTFFISQSLICARSGGFVVTSPPPAGQGATFKGFNCHLSLVVFPGLIYQRIQPPSEDGGTRAGTVFPFFFIER